MVVVTYKVIDYVNMILYLIELHSYVVLFFSKTATSVQDSDWSLFIVTFKKVVLF